MNKKKSRFVIRLPRETRGLLRGVNQFLNPSLSVIIAALFAVVIMGFGESVRAEVFVNEGFEDGAFDPPYQYLCDPNDPNSPPQTGPCTNTAEHVTNEKKSGNYSLECVFNLAQAAGCRIFPSDYGHDNFGEVAHVRLYIKYDTEYLFHHKVKVFRWHKVGNDPYVNINGVDSTGISKDVSGTPYGDIGVYVTGCGFTYVSDEMANRGENQEDWIVNAGDGWWMIEVEFDSINHTCDLWVQRPQDATPTKVFDDLFLANLDQGNFGGIDINWLNSIDGPSGGKNWLDEIVIADQYIGPIDASDLTPPSRSNGQPTGTLASGTTSTTISLDTDETAECKYSVIANTNYDDMSNVFAMTDSTDHSTDVTDLEDGNSYTYYVKCQDELNNQNTDDFEISFSIASPSITYSISNFINLVTDWLKSESGLESDVNGDGVVNTRDLGIMMSNWQ